MQSPFEIFRKHQKMLTVILTGLAMFAFVILGAVPDPSNMPPALTAVFLAGVLGGIGWIAGIRNKKSNEWGTGGVIAGLVLGVVATIAVGPQDVVKAATGDIDQQQLGNLIHQRGAANQFVNLAFQRAVENGAQRFQPPTTFGFGHPDETRDIVVAELLRREADRLGLQVTDEAVNDFIRSVTQNKIGATDVREIRNMLGLSEADLYAILGEELKALTMARFLYGGTTLPPETYWDFYRQMNVQQSVSVVPVAVEAFVDKATEPAEAELQKLFAEHKANYQNMTTEGRLDEGRPGFRQPRKIRLEFVEIPYEAVEKTIGEITDAEIEAFYEEFYKTAPELPMLDDTGATPEGDKPAADAPLLPPLAPSKDETPKDSPPEGATPKPETPEDNPAKPTTESPAETKDEPTSDSPKPAEESKPEETAKPQAPANEVDAPQDDAPAPVSQETPADDTPPSDGGAATGGEQSRATSGRQPSVQLVAFLDDTPPTEQPAAETPDAAQTPEAVETPEAEKPQAAADSAASDEKAAQTPADKGTEDTPPPAGDKPADKDAASPEKPATETPATDKPDDAAEMKKDATSPPADAPPADGTAPADTPADGPGTPAQPRELDDELRAEIRDQILRRKTVDRMQELVTEVYEYMLQDLALQALAAEDDPTYLSPADVSAKLQAFAKERGLNYESTPLLTFRELSESEDYAIGRAASDTNFQASQDVAQTVFSSSATSLYSTQSVLEIESGSRFVYWKTEDAAAYEPDSLEAPGIREQVVRTWRELQAREQAQKRADELAKQASGIDKPLSEVLAGATVTGDPEGQAVTVVHPPRFSWLSRANPQMSPNPFNQPAPQRTELRTVPGMIGDQFMDTAFNQLQPGEVGVTHSVDKAYYYVVKVEDRSYGTSEDVQAFRERFTREPLFAPFGFSDYAKLANAALNQYRTNWAEELFERHKVDFSQLDAQRQAEPQS